MKLILLKVIPSFLVFLGIIYVLFFSQYFQIKEIKISGAKTISEDSLRERVNAELLKKVYFFMPQNNLFLFPAQKIKTNFLKEFPKIRKVFIKRGFLNFLEIKIEEREMAAIWCKDKEIQLEEEKTSPPESPDSLPILLQNCFFIDGEGVIFENAPAIEGSLIFKISDKSERNEVKVGDKIFEPDFLNGIFNAKKNFEENLGVSFPEFTVLDSGILEANASSGWKIIFEGVSDNLNIQIRALKKVFDEMPPEEKDALEYFDLRIDGRIYYK